jgi:hypothetical protein
MARTYNYLILEDEKKRIKKLYNIYEQNVNIGTPGSDENSVIEDNIDFNDYTKLARDIVSYKYCNFDEDFENILPQRNTQTNAIVITAKSKVDKPEYSIGDEIEFNIGSPVKTGIYFTNTTKGTKTYFACDGLTKEINRISTKLIGLLANKGYFSANSPQLREYQNQLNNPSYFDSKEIDELAIDYKNSLGFNPLYYKGPKFFYKKLQNTTENAQLTPEQLSIADLFAQKYSALKEHQLSPAEQVNYQKINLKDYNSTFKDDYFMLVPRLKIKDINNDYKKGSNLLQLDKETVFGCSKLFKTYNELYFRYKNNPNTTESSLSDIKPNLEYCYRKFKNTKLGGEMFKFTNQNNKDLGPFILKV